MLDILLQNSFVVFVKAASCKLERPQDKMDSRVYSQSVRVSSEIKTSTPASAVEASCPHYCYSSTLSVYIFIAASLNITRRTNGEASLQ